MIIQKLKSWQELKQTKPFTTLMEVYIILWCAGVVKTRQLERFQSKLTSIVIDNINKMLRLTFRYFLLFLDMLILQSLVHPHLSHCNLKCVLLNCKYTYVRNIIKYLRNINLARVDFKWCTKMYFINIGNFSSVKSKQLWEDLIHRNRRNWIE